MPTAASPFNAASAAVAKSVGLRYVNANDPGLTRIARGKTFHYRDATGRAVTDARTLARIKRLAIPPAWTEVWICPHDNGHIQAVGRDARGRKQYRYHPDWRATRDETKYERMIGFGQALPKIRQRVARDLLQPGLGRRKVLATIVRLLETTLVRVGNEEYARANGSFGLSTLQDRHAKIASRSVRFEFKGKSGKRHVVEVHDPRLARIVRQAQELPGQELFQYVDDNGRVQDVKSDDVNAYLREIAGAEFSAKDFRTWAGTVLAALALHSFDQFKTKAQAKKNIVQAIEKVAAQLGNTPAVCRKCYIHPVILSSYLDGATIATLRDKAEAALGHGLPRLSGAEGAVLAFLEERLRQPRTTLIAALRRTVARNRRRQGAHRGGRDRGRARDDGAVAATKSLRRRSAPSTRRTRR